MNKKNFIKLFLLTLTITSTAFSKAHTNKTFMMPRSQLDNLALEVSSWHTQVMKKDSHNFAGSLQATGFYQKSDNKSGLGKYFGYHADKERTNRNFISIDPLKDPTVAIDFTSDDIPVGYIYHNPQNIETKFGGKIRFNPSQEAYGLRLDWYQNLWKFFFKINAPITYIKTNMNISSIGDVPLALLFDEPGNYHNLFDYFTGKIEYLNNAESTQLQKKLTHAKFGGAHDRCGIADINASLGYTFLNHNNCRAGLAMNVTFPTGHKATGEWLFEPMLGNGKHWGLGVELDSKLRLWDEGRGKSRDAIDFLFFANLKYLFDDTEKRTLGLLYNDGKKIKYGHYYLAGKKGEYQVFPLANILTRDIKVDPRLQFELLTSLAFSSENVTFDIGYNLFVKEDEKIFLKNNWDEETYAIANPGYPGNPSTEGYFTRAGVDPNEGLFDPTNSSHYDAKTIPGPIQFRNLDFDAARTPSQVTHKIYGALNYAFYEWKNPLMLGLGASYEFNSGNASLEGYTIWAKASIAY